jgi:hypothetical protein
MQRYAFVAVVLGGCLSNPTVEVDTQSIDVPRGASHDVLVSIDGTPVSDLGEVLWTVENDDVATVTPSYDGYHLRIGGDHEGDTVVHVNSHGQDVAIPVHVGPPAVVMIWAEPTIISAHVGDEVQVRAKSLDTLARVRDITFDSRWVVRDDSMLVLDQAGMMLHATGTGSTTLHVANGTSTTVVPVSIYK